MSHAGAGRVRSRSQSRAAAATLTTRDPDSESEPDADSDSELAAQDPCSDSGSETGSGPPHSGRVVHICVGCGKSFGSDSSLRRHRNSRWMTDPACRNGGLKRPKFGRAAGPGAGDSSRDADALVRQTMGDCRPSPGAAPNPPLQPINEVCSPAFGLHILVFGLHLVCTVLVCSIYVSVCTWFALSIERLHMVCTRFVHLPTKSAGVHGRRTTWAATLPRWIKDCTGMIVSRAHSTGNRGRPGAPMSAHPCPGTKVMTC